MSIDRRRLNELLVSGLLDFMITFYGINLYFYFFGLNYSFKGVIQLRRNLIKKMYAAAEKYPQVHWNFCHKLVSCDFETKILTFERLKIVETCKN